MTRPSTYRTAATPLLHVICCFFFPLLLCTTSLYTLSPLLWSCNPACRCYQSAFWSLLLLVSLHCFHDIFKENRPPRGCRWIPVSIFQESVLPKHPKNFKLVLKTLKRLLVSCCDAVVETHVKAIQAQLLMEAHIQEPSPVGSVGVELMRISSSCEVVSEFS